MSWRAGGVCEKGGDDSAAGFYKLIISLAHVSVYQVCSARIHNRAQSGGI